ncbi:MAG TPA: beta-xylosidase [Pseudonocardiaceae bacterium]|nr:beta-xylosidase [Pseudonocardiaceae bacterium]
MKEPGGQLDTRIDTGRDTSIGTGIDTVSGTTRGTAARPRSFRPRLVTALVVAGCLVLAACGGTTGIPQADGTDGGGLPMPGAIHAVVPPKNSATDARSGPVKLTVSADHSSGVVASGGPNAPYNYAPSVMTTGGVDYLWWCSQLPGAARPGDQILYATGTSQDGPFAAPGGAPGTEVFGNSPNGFDQLHTCDPSVVRVGGIYYLYYTGTSNTAGQANAIGLATSTDGVHWNRANGGAPIVVAADDNTTGNPYGAGQPSVVYVDGWFYLLFTDTTGKAADPNGAGQFVLRSANPVFTSGVEALGPDGFTPVASTKTPRLRSVLAANTADWMWVDALNAFAIAADSSAGTTITFWNGDFSAQPYQPVTLPGPAQDGPGLVRTPTGHAPISTTDPCGQLSLDLIRATSDAAAPTNLTHYGTTVTGFNGCQTTAQAIDVLNGFAMPSPDRTVDVLANGKLIDFERRSVALAVATGMLDTQVPALADLPIQATIDAGSAAVTTPGEPVGLEATNGILCLVSGADTAQLNSSIVVPVTSATWDGYPGGCDLSALRP